MKLIILLFLTFSSYIQQDKDFLTFSLVRHDGIIVPLFRCENSKWVKIYNKPNEFRSYERFVFKWYLYQDSSTSQVLKRSTPVHFNYDNESSFGYGYLSDSFFLPAVKIATSKPFELETAKSLKKDEKKFQQIENIILSDFRSDKSFKVDKLRDHLNNDDDKLVDLYSVTYYEFDTIKIYFSTSGKHIKYYDSCEYFFINYQWFLERGSEFKSIYKAYTFDDRDYKSSSGMDKHCKSAFKLNGEIYLIIDDSGWESTDYELLKFENNELEGVFSQFH